MYLLRDCDDMDFIKLINNLEIVEIEYKVIEED